MGALEKNKQEPDTRTKLENLKRVLENKVRTNNQNIDAAKKLEEIKRLEAKTEKEKLTQAELDTIEKEYAELDELEKMIEESPDIITKPQKVTPEAPKDFMSNIGTMIENLQNSLAYHLAPILSALQSIPFLAGDGNISMLQAFLGGEKTMMFHSLRQKNLEPIFNAKNPSEDTKAINAIIDMAKKVQGIHSGYTLKKFFETASEKFAEHMNGERKFKLEDFATFTEKNVLPEEVTTAKKEQAENPEQAAVIITPEDKNGIIKLQQGQTEMSVKRNDTGTIQLDGKEWKLVQTGKDDVLKITKITLEKDTNGQDRGKMMVDTGSMGLGLQPAELTQEILKMLMTNVKKGTPVPPFTVGMYSFEFKSV